MTAHHFAVSHFAANEFAHVLLCFDPRDTEARSAALATLGQIAAVNHQAYVAAYGDRYVRDPITEGAILAAARLLLACRPEAAAMTLTSIEYNCDGLLTVELKAALAGLLTTVTRRVLDHIDSIRAKSGFLSDEIAALKAELKATRAALVAAPPPAAPARKPRTRKTA